MAGDSQQKKRGDAARKSETLSDSAVITAVSHPVRRQILRVYEDGVGRSAKDLTSVVPLPLGNISYHLDILKKAGVVTPLRNEQRRGGLKKICVSNLDRAGTYVTEILRATREQDEIEVPKAESGGSSSDS